MAKAVGSLARELGGGSKGKMKARRGAARRRGEVFDVQGLVVNERFTKRLMSPDELDEYTLVRETDTHREREREREQAWRWRRRKR